METAIVLPITDVGFYSAEDVIDFHLKKEQKSREVYFSTSHRMDSKKANLVDYVILVKRNLHI